jgi:hypothetical protein
MHSAKANSKCARFQDCPYSITVIVIGIQASQISAAKKKTLHESHQAFCLKLKDLTYFPVNQLGLAIPAPAFQL